MLSIVNFFAVNDSIKLYSKNSYQTNADITKKIIKITTVFFIGSLIFENTFITKEAEEEEE